MSATDLWATPWEVIAAILNKLPVEIVVDVCASRENAKCRSYITEQEDALKADWYHRAQKQQYPELIPAAWCNPPYSKPAPWVASAIRHYQVHRLNTLLLVKGDFSTKWFRQLMECDGLAKEIPIATYLMSPRIQHVRPKSLVGEARNSNEFCSALCWIGAPERVIEYWRWKK